jgi:NADH dehydrogenase
METGELNVVTGAFGYTGKYITKRLLAAGKRVKTLTGHPDRPNPFGDQVSIAALAFENPGKLTRSMEGAATLYNTYWIRFPYGDMTYEKAVENSQVLLKAAGEAGVRRVVHISIANAAEDSPFPYYRGKGILEKAIAASGLSYAIIRPTVIFGLEDVLVNNITWLIRKFPLFAVPGSGGYKLQPVYVEDVAEIAVDAGRRDGNLIINAAGPETYTFNKLLRLIAAKVGSSTRLIHLRPELALRLAKVIGYIVNDVVLTEDEIYGLMAGLLVCDGTPTGRTRLSEWLSLNASTVGAEYTSELNRHYR